MSHMKTSITVRLDTDTVRALDKLADETGRSRSELVREALRRELAVTRFDALRRRIAPFAEAKGWLTDEDVFRHLS